MPADGVHVVRRGETLTRIAARYGISEAQIVSASGLVNTRELLESLFEAKERQGVPAPGAPRRLA